MITRERIRDGNHPSDFTRLSSGRTSVSKSQPSNFSARARQRDHIDDRSKSTTTRAPSRKAVKSRVLVVISEVCTVGMEERRQLNNVEIFH